MSAVAVAAYEDHEYVHSGVNGDIPVRLSAKAANLSSMVGRFGDLGAAIDACEYWYGPYAYGRVGYVLTTDGALEIPTNIAYPQFMSTQSIIENRGLLTHELGHSWWGDVVTPYIHNDMWLKEGPAEYSGHLIEEWLGGAAAFYKVVKDNHLFVLRSAHLNDGGFQALSPMPDPYIYGTHTYYKGASVMHNLRGYLGDELFRQALRGIQQNNANTAITAEEFKNALEEQSGVDLDPFFDAWVFEPGFAAFEVRNMELLSTGDMTEVSVLIGQKLRATASYHTEVPLDITFISADGEVNDQAIVASGEETTVQLTVPFEPAMVVLNRYGRLNQARMDHEITLVPGAVFSNLLPYVDFRLYATELVDSTLVRIDHMWSGPDQGPLAAEIIAIGNTHYWNVDGLWPEGTVLQGRMYYYGQANQFDEELIDGNENGIAVLYRPTPMDEWVICPDQDVNAGNLTNGVGSITVSNLQKGQYCFGKIDGSTTIEEAMDDRPLTFTMGPVPTLGQLSISGSLDGQGLLWCDIFGPDGRMVRRTALAVNGAFNGSLDVTDLANGIYIMRIQDARSGVHQEQRFEVLR
ncbi:MAG: M1 family aminopeptidase [Flavobacteriales bacterium]